MAASTPAARAGDFLVSPAAVSLEGNFAQTQLVVTAHDSGSPSERSPDLTRQASYVSSNTRVATVSPTGRVLAVGNGAASVTITVAGTARSVTVKVSGIVAEPVIGFGEQVMPIISKAGCNAGACHASQYGKGGFKLSVFGYAPSEDHFAITRGALNRRVSLADPARSLVLLKPTASVPHGGGRRFEVGSVDYQILHAWIASRAPGPKPGAAHVTAFAVTPSRRVGKERFTQQLQVIATYSDGKKRDVTAWAKYDSMDESVVRVTPQGWLETIGKGQGAVMVRFEGQAQIAQVVVPYADSVDLSGWVENNFIDKWAAAKFKEIGIAPSPLCDDATFLRRAYLSAIGTLPTVEQASAFLASTDRDKRKKLVDELLGLTGDSAKDVHNNDYAAYWSLKWSDLLRSSSAALGEQGMWAMHNWLTASFRENKPFDKFVRELVTAKGSTYDNGPSNYFVVFGNADGIGEATAQLFLGMRVQCAKCHHHPFEALSRADYQEFASFFNQIGSKGSANYGKLGGPKVILVRPGGGPVPKQVLGMPLHRRDKPGGSSPVGGGSQTRPQQETTDKRQVLADWLTARDNKYFARNIVNRYVAYLLGRGLVEPIDDLRATNPPSNVELMDALAEDFAKSGYNVKHLMRTIMQSRLYQLDSRPTEANAADRHFYTHYNVQRIAAEPLLDAIDAVTGVPTKFAKVPLGTRAIELPDAQYDDYFLKTFGKPKREGICECERVSDPNLAQALHTLNSDAIVNKIANPKGRVAKLLAAKKAHADIVTELYLATLSRRPSDAEQKVCKELLAEAPDAKTFYEDLLWTLINSKQFLFVR
jgi:hypothetical protein